MVCLPKGPKDPEEEENAKAFFDSENQRTMRLWRTLRSSSVKKREGSFGSVAALLFPAIMPGR
jgi:hypothetical protein